MTKHWKNDERQQNRALRQHTKPITVAMNGEEEERGYNTNRAMQLNESVICSHFPILQIHQTFIILAMWCDFLISKNAMENKRRMSEGNQFSIAWQKLSRRWQLWQLFILHAYKYHLSHLHSICMARFFENICEWVCDLPSLDGTYREFTYNYIIDIVQRYAFDMEKVFFFSRKQRKSAVRCALTISVDTYGNTGNGKTREGIEYAKNKW